MEFILPLKFEHLLQQPSDDKYWVQEFVNLESWDDKRQSRQLDIIMNELFKSNESPCEIKNLFDILYSFISQVDKVSPENQEKIVNFITAAFNNMIDIIEKNVAGLEDYLEQLKIYLFLLYGIFTKFKTFSSVKSLKVINKALPIVRKISLPGKPEARLI